MGSFQGSGYGAASFKARCTVGCPDMFPRSFRDIGVAAVTALIPIQLRPMAYGVALQDASSWGPQILDNESEKSQFCNKSCPSQTCRTSSRTNKLPQLKLSYVAAFVCAPRLLLKSACGRTMRLQGSRLCKLDWLNYSTSRSSDCWDKWSTDPDPPSASSTA